MKNIYYKPRTKKEAALQWTEALIKGRTKTYKKSPAFDPKNDNSRTEAEVLHLIVNYLDIYFRRGELFYQRINTTGIYDQERGLFRSLPRGVHKGFPDVFILVRGEVIFLECKSSKGDQSDDQVIMQELLEKQGAQYYVIRTLDALTKVLGRYFPTPT